jgi:hypothetical protein
VRDQALALACRRLDLEVSNGRGFDSLPADVLDPLKNALVGNLTVDELRRALATATAGLLREATHIPGQGARRVRSELKELCGTVPILPVAKR